MSKRTVVLPKVLFLCFRNIVGTNIRRIANHGVESAGLYDRRKIKILVESIDSQPLLVVEVEPPVEKIRPDKRVSALYVVVEVRQKSLAVVEPLESFVRFAFKHF